MALKGDLASVDLAQVFQMLALNQKVGLLGIQSPTSWKALYFDERGVTLYFNEHIMLDRVLSRLIRSGAIAADGVEDAREHASRHGQTVVDALLAGGYLAEDDLDAGIRNEIEEEIYELFFWYDAKFEFFEGTSEFDGREGVIHDRFFFGTDILIMEAARRIDEWSYISSQVPDGLEILRHVVGATRAFDLDDEHFQIYELTDAKRNVDRLVEVTGIPSFHVFKALATLVDQGFVEPVPSDCLVPAGQECMSEGRMQDAINLFERAVSINVGLPHVHSLASEAYDAIAEYELSAYHTKCVAEIHASNGERREAIDLFKWVLETIPTDLNACQRVVELSVGRPELSTEDFDPLQVGKDLVDLYLEIGEVERVRVLLEELLREHPNDIELKKSLINVHTKAGDTRRVVELYESIAEDLTRNGDPIQAIKYLQKVMQIDRSRKDISERIKLLYRVDERKRSRRRSLVALGLVFCTLVVGAVGYYFYNQTARGYYNKLYVQPLIEKKDFPGAIRLIKGFLETYPFTMVAQEAEADLVNLEARHRANKAELQRKVSEEAAELDRIRYEYKAGWVTHLKKFEARDLAGALADIDKVRKLVAQAGQPMDRKWEVTKNVVKSLNDLKTYLAMAAALERKARAALDSGDWKSARKHVLELIAKFEMSEQAKLAQIPVMCLTKPSGAMIQQGGKPLTQIVDGKVTPILTPTVILCPNRDKIAFEFVKAGFEPKVVTVQPLEKGSIGRILTIKSEDLTFEHPAHTPAGIGSDGTIVVGLRGGRLGIKRPRSRPVLIKLPGLGEVEGPPSLTSRVVVFATNENSLLCYRLRDRQQVWNIKVRHPLSAPVSVANGRAFLVDEEGRVFCVSVLEGRELWVKDLNGRASGRPTIHGRTVTVGSLGGTVMVLDAQTGGILKRLTVQRAVTTRVMRNDKLLIFGTEDGRLQAYRMGTKTVVWTLDIGRAIRSDEIVMSENLQSVMFVGANNTLFRVKASDGKVMVNQKLKHRIRPGLLAHNGRVFLVVHEAYEMKGVKMIYRDLLLALDEHTFEVEWEFRDGGDFKGRLIKGSKHLLLTGSNGEVHQFR